MEERQRTRPWNSEAVRVPDSRVRPNCWTPFMCIFLWFHRFIPLTSIFPLLVLSMLYYPAHGAPTPPSDRCTAYNCSICCFRYVTNSSLFTGSPSPVWPSLPNCLLTLTSPCSSSFGPTMTVNGV